MTAQEVRRVRLDLGLSQVQLAQILGVHHLTVSKWERGVAKPTEHQTALLQSFGKARHTNQNVGEETARLLLTAGVIAALYFLLKNASGD